MIRIAASLSAALSIAATPGVFADTYPAKPPVGRVVARTGVRPVARVAVGLRPWRDSRRDGEPAEKDGHREGRYQESRSIHLLFPPNQ